MKKLILLTILLFATVSCNKSEKVKVIVTFDNGEKDTVVAESSERVYLLKGDLKMTGWVGETLASGVRTYKILNND